MYNAGSNAASQEVFSTCELVGCDRSDVMMYMTGINTTTQEVLSMALGAE